MSVEMEKQKKDADSKIELIKKNMKSCQHDAEVKIKQKEDEMKSQKEEADFQIESFRDELKYQQADAETKIESIRKEAESKDERLRMEMRFQNEKAEEKAELIRKNAEEKQEVIRKEAEQRQREAKQEADAIRQAAESKEQSLREKMKSEKDKAAGDLERSRQQAWENEQKANAEKVEAVNNLSDIKSEMYERMIQMQAKDIDRYEKFTKSVLDSQAELFQVFSASITEGLARIAIGLGTQDVSPSLALKNPWFVLIHNFVRDDKARKPVTRDIGALSRFLGNIGDALEERKGEALASASKACGEEDCSDYDGILVVVFASGSNMIMQDKECPISVGEVCKPFVENSDLSGKPKIFLIHALKPSDDESPSDDEYTSPDDCLTCYCEMPEDVYTKYFSNGGSLFVKSFCEVMKKNRKKDIAEILDIVKDQVMDEYEEGVTFTISSSLAGPVTLWR